MPLLLIFALTAACLRVPWPAPLLGGGPETALAFTATTLVLSIASAFALRTWVVVTLRRAPERRSEVARVYSHLRHRMFFINLTLAAVCVLVFGWGWMIASAPTGGSTELFRKLLVVNWHGKAHLAPFAELAVPLPYFIILFCAWLIYYDAERALHQSVGLGLKPGEFWSRAGYFLNHLRQFVLMVMLPVLLFVVQQNVAEFFPDTVRQDWYRFGALAAMFAVFLLLPLAIKPLLGLCTLPGGPTRARLEALAKRLHFSCADFLLWPTHGAAANAMIVGLLPRVRYVIFTDRILEDLPPDELDAVFGHEVGHARHGHIWFYFLFFALSIFTLAAALLFLDQYRVASGVEIGGWAKDWIVVLPLVFVAGYIFVVWGFLSRRCERQADVFGCRAVSCDNPHCLGHDAATVYPERGEGLCPTGIRTFISALQHVDLVNGNLTQDERHAGPLHAFVIGVLKWLRAWQHSTMSRRIAFLRSLIGKPALERDFQRSVRLLRWGVILILLGTLVALGQSVGWVELYEEI